ncbi:toprim domain-containing protein, partial [Dysosmobacter sp.]|uniref:toprim domain-containing protein n=1 Tax=Dysosmobacter sp. TaxID=2591382 RepID=UPI003AB4ED2B
GQVKYAGLRGTYDRDGKGFRGDVTGSDKHIGFTLPYDRSSDQVFVFEAPIDLMSYLTLHRNTPNALALCGLYDGALQAYLADHPQIKRIELSLDADGPGREAARQFQNKYAAMGYAVTVEEPRSGKDWNEYLQKRKTPERGR